MRATARGFTLVEVLVALSLAGVLLLGARGLVDAIGEHARALLASARAADAHANAELELRRGVADLVIAQDTAASLVGTPELARFTSWCTSPHGWLERCERRIRVQRDGTALGIWTEEPDGAMVLRQGLQRAELRYLESALAGGVWRSRWEGTILLPIAIAIVADADTLVVPIGERR